MAGESISDPQIEIGHVLAMDVVGYSKLLIREQTELLRRLSAIVRGTTQVRTADAEGMLIRLPTGDGMTLVFFGNPEAPLECATEISTALKNEPDILLRIGIHSGPINRVLDVNERANLAGAGIDLAQRVMDCGDAGHILLSKRVTEDLAPYARWNSHLFELGECTVKHGRKIELVNFYTNEVGNAKRPLKLGINEDSAALSTPARSPWPTKMAGVLVLLSLGSAIWWFATQRSRQVPVVPVRASSPAVIPEKSIAILPFENLSEEKANAYFADGVQDEILTNLAKIADLKVISRTSVMQYRSGAPRNLREIGQQLGVAHLLEGSVQRAEGKVRVNAQLIDARTDAHLWAQTYDRTLADIFTIQSDIARAIAEQLQAKLAPDEKTLLVTRPTNNSEAYLFYLQANELVHIAASRTEAVEADNLYAKAIALDPQFALAYARGAILNSLMYFVGRNPARKIRGRALADEAMRLAPNLGEAHLALALCFYRLEANYEQALAELAKAGAVLPNNSEVFDFSGYVFRRQGRWREALAAFQHAMELDPRRGNFDGPADTLRSLRLWAGADEAYKKGLQIEPQLVEGWVGLAYVRFVASGKPSAATTVFDPMPKTLENKPGAKEAKWDYAMMVRDFDAAEKNFPEPGVDEFPAFEPGAYFRACIEAARGNRAQAQGFLEEVRSLHETGVRDHPADPTFHSALGKVYALLGRKEEAIREARRAVELCPESKDAVSAPLFATNLAFVFAQSGEAEQAIDLLARLLTMPGAERVTLAHLRLSWEWDPLRTDPRFQALLAGPESATVYQ